MAFASIKSSAKGGSDFKPVSAGVHFAICTQLIDLGTQNTTFKGAESRKRQVYIKFEIPDERVEWDKDGKHYEGPATVGRTFTNSIGEKSNLRPFLEGWRGKAFSKEEEDGFELTSIVGKVCQIGVVHDVGANGKTYTNISSVLPLSKDTQAAIKAGTRSTTPEGELLVYSTDDPDEAIFAKLPKWLQDKINARVVEKATAVQKTDEPDFDDDIPF